MTEGQNREKQKAGNGGNDGMKGPGPPFYTRIPKSIKRRNMRTMKKILAVILFLALMAAVFGSLAEETEAPAAPFETMYDTKTGTDWSAYSSPNYYIVLSLKNGRWWRVDARIDDRFSELTNALDGAEDREAAYAELDVYLDTLPVASAVELSEQPLATGTLNAYAGKTLRDIMADGFRIEYIQTLSPDGEGEGPEWLDLTDDEGNTFNVPCYLFDGNYEGNVMFCLKKGIYSYGFVFDVKESQLRKTIGEGTWDDLEACSAKLHGLNAAAACKLPAPIEAEPEDGEEAEEETTLRTIGQIEELLNQACYVNPEGGRYVHTVPDCAIVHPKFIPLTKVEYTDEIKAAYAFCPVCCLNEYHAETQGE